MWLGIDFGTCYSSASIVKKGILTPVKFGANITSLLSSVFVDKDGKILVGQTAEHKRGIDPSRYKKEFKRDLGIKEPYLLGNSELLPYQLVVEILKKLKEDAEPQFLTDTTFTSAVITVPAHYKDNKRKLMKKAAEEAGLEHIEIMDEPVAAAIYYSSCSGSVQDTGRQEVILVYDLGGGTFDAALIQRQGENYKLLALPAGHEQIGGSSFDRLIYKDFINNSSAQLREIIQRRDKKGLLTRLLIEDECQNVKHHLTDDSTAMFTIPVESIEEYSLTREYFNSLIEPFIEETVDICLRLIENTGLLLDQIDRILLVGGSCRIPYVQESAKKSFKGPVFLVDEPELAVCFGAALHGNYMKLLVQCPECRHEFKGVQQGQVICPQCKKEFEIDKKGNIIDPLDRLLRTQLKMSLLEKYPYLAFDQTLLNQKIEEYISDPQLMSNLLER